MTLNDIMIAITSAPILDVDEELEKAKREQEYNWSFDANGSPIEIEEEAWQIKKLFNIMDNNG